MEEIFSDYPDAVFFESGFPVSRHHKIEDRILVWANESESENDDGAHAIASIYSCG
jgi:hypothetical protein